MLEWQKNHGLGTNKENSGLAIKCESPLSPTSRRFRLKRPYDDDTKRSYDADYTRFGNEENEEVFRRNYQRNMTGNKTEFFFGKDHLKVLRNQYYLPTTWRHMPFRNLGERNGNNLLMIAPASKGDEKEDNCKDKADGKDK